MELDFLLLFSWFVTTAIISISVLIICKPSEVQLNLEQVQKMFKNYWIHIFVGILAILSKFIVDNIDRSLMVKEQLDMTELIFLIEGKSVLFFQETLRHNILDFLLTHFYIIGLMTTTFCTFIFPLYFDDRKMANRVSTSILWSYFLAVPFFLFFNVRVTGDYITEMESIAYNLSPEINSWFRTIDTFSNGMPSLHVALPLSAYLTLRNWNKKEWNKFQNFLLVMISLTIFSILYLGIHWILDIIAGFIIAMLAVMISNKTNEAFWRFTYSKLSSK
tara:strand:+ start:4519 stop:5346 length:828 start_codon:yes stop_codon:yes gene_type:complete